MKKTDLNKKKLQFQRQIVRALTPTELERAVGGEAINYGPTGTPMSIDICPPRY